MEAKIQMINKNYGHAEAITTNVIAVVFKLPTDCEIKLGDIIDIDLLRLDEEQTVKNINSNTTFYVVIKSNDVHDTHLPVTHGSRRFPTLERRKGA